MYDHGGAAISDRGLTRIRPAAWLMAAVALFLLAVAGYALLVHASPHYYWTQIDTAVYRDGGIAVRNHPAMLYALELGAAKVPGGGIRPRGMRFRRTTRSRRDRPVLPAWRCESPPTDGA